MLLPFIHDFDGGHETSSLDTFYFERLCWMIEVTDSRIYDDTVATAILTVLRSMLCLKNFV